MVFWEGGSAERALSASSDLVVGRSRESDLWVNHPSVSRKHVLVRMIRGSGDESFRVELEDLGGQNGTRVGGERLTPNTAVILAVGEAVEIGDALLVVRAEDAEPRGSSALQEREREIARIAAAAVNVVIYGEAGVGKARVAESMHLRSARRALSLVRIQCVGEASGVERELLGQLPRVRGGALFLDGVDALPPSLQTKVSTMIDAGATPASASDHKLVDVRIYASASRDLGDLVHAGRFREDLRRRLAGLRFVLPPLRDRRDEIATLTQAILDELCRASGRTGLAPSRVTLRLLEGYSWPGNVRELQSVLAHAVAHADGAPTLDPSHLPEELRRVRPGVGNGIDDLKDEIARRERVKIEDALAKTNGNQTRAAHLLGISRRTLINRLEAYRAKRPRKR